MSINQLDDLCVCVCVCKTPTLTPETAADKQSMHL